jgi:hypothetical protein
MNARGLKIENGSWPEAKLNECWRLSSAILPRRMAVIEFLGRGVSIRRLSRRAKKSKQLLATWWTGDRVEDGRLSAKTNSTNSNH